MGGRRAIPLSYAATAMSAASMMALGRAARTGSPVRTLEDGIERSRLFERARVKRPSQRRLGVFSLVPRPQSLGARRIEIHRRAREG